MIYNGFSKKKSLKMDLNISKYAVFHGDFESAFQTNPNIVKNWFITVCLIFMKKSLKMDLNLSKYAVFHGDFESAFQMNPRIVKKLIYNGFLDFWGEFF